MLTLASDVKKELLQNPEFKAEYDALESEFAQAAKVIERSIANQQLVQSCSKVHKTAHTAHGKQHIT